MRTLYFCPAVSSSFFFFDRLISAVAEWMSTILLHMVVNWPLACDGVPRDRSMTVVVTHNIRCHSDTNVPLPCYQLREVLNVVSKIRSDMQVHTQHQIRHIHQLVRDLPIDTIDRSKRGLMTQLLSRITGLASQTDLHVLEQIEKGYYEASVLWGKGEKSLMAAFKLDQDRMQNVFDILAEYRQSIRQLQYEFMYTKRYARRSIAVIMAMALQFLHNNTVSISQVNALYNAVETLMTGNIPHFLLPHTRGG